MDPFKRGASRAEAASREEMEFQDRKNRLLSESISRIYESCKDSFTSSGYRYYNSGNSIIIYLDPEIQTDEVSYTVSAWLDKNTMEVYFTLNRFFLHTISRKMSDENQKLNETEVLEALGEFFGRTSANVNAKKTKLERDRRTNAKYLARQRIRDALLEGLDNAKPLLSWLILGIIALVFLGIIF